MSAFNNAVLTDLGAQMLMNVQNGGDTLTFTRMALGDGKMQHEFDQVEMKGKTALGQEKLVVPITDKQPFPARNAVVLAGRIDNSSLNTGFKARECGIYAANKTGGGKLYAYAYAGDEASFVPDKSKSTAGSVVRVAVSVVDAEATGVEISLPTLMSPSQLAAVQAQITTGLVGAANDIAGRVSPQITALEQRLAAVESVNTAQNDDIAGLTTRMGAAEGTNTAQDGSISAVEDVNTTQSGDIASLSTRLGAVESRSDYELTAATDADIDTIFDVAHYSA